MAIVANPTLSDGTYEIELQMEDWDEDPQHRIAEMEIVGGKGDRTQGMGRGNLIRNGTVVVHRDTPINDSAAGDIDNAEDLLNQWAENNTILTLTEDDGTTTDEVMIKVQWDKNRDITPVLIRGSLEMVEA